MTKNFKSLTIIAAMLIGMTAMAQSVSLNFEPQSKGLEKKNRLTYVGSNGQSVVFKQLMGLLGTSEELVSYDLNQKEQGRVKFDNIKVTGTPVIQLREAIVNGDKLDIIATTDKDNKYLVYHEQRDIKTLNTIGERQVLASFDDSKDDNHFCFTAQSPNGQLVGVATIKLEKNFDATVRATLYSRQMEEYWSMEVPAHGFGSILVTDDGDIVLSGITVKDNRATVQMSVTDGENSEKYLFNYPAEGMLLEYSPARYDDGQLLLVATMRENSKSIMPVGSNIDCVDAITCNTKDNTIQRDRHHFSSEERCIMDNKKGKKAQTDWIDFGNLVQVIGDKEGAFVVIDKTWSTYRDGSLAYRQRSGMMVLRIGKDGLFKWGRAERHSAFANGMYINWIDYRWEPTSEGIMLAWTTNQSDISVKGTDKPVKGTKNFGKKANLSVVTLDREGNKRQTDFNIGKQAIFSHAWHLDENNWLVLVSSNGAGAFGKLNISF
ncbi:MAG: hypothetical protein J6W88_00500 [Bacteroidales bacterium]|nr:hypothetical protein [Bacteroidales bacterium]